MKNNLRSPILIFLGFCLIFAACKSDPFVGSWKPAPSSDNDVTRVDSFNINKDKTFSIKFKDSSRKDITGTYVNNGGKLELSAPDQKTKVEVTLQSDGRLAVTEGSRPPVYFVKAG
jgi:hypothetical protein